MNLNDIKNAAAAIHERPTGDFTVSGQDLFLVAANNAIKEAQLLHRFNSCRISGTIDIPGSDGASLATATINGLELLFTASSTPATAGTYVVLGLYNGYLAWYATVGANRFFVYYHSGHASYIIATVIQTANHTSYWIKASDPTNPIGTYNPVTYTGNPAATSTNSRLVKWREVVAVTRTRADGTHQPIDFTRQDIAIERDRYELELSDDFWPINRYPSDADVLAGAANSTVVQAGNSLYLHPKDVTATTPLSVNLYGIGWLKEYTAADLTASDPVDFIVEHGHQWLMWSVVKEVNFRWKTFVPRTEGNLGPPDQERAIAWRNLVLWDSYLVDSNVTRSR